MVKHQMRSMPLGYDTAYFLADAIKRAGSADSVKIKEALETIKRSFRL